MNNPYIGRMTQASQLAPYAQTIVLPSVGRIFYYDSANIAARETIILVHGLQDEADTWRHLFQPLMQRYRVLALDLPGFGRSDKAHRNYTPLFFADTLLQFMDALKIGHATLVGNSLGGMIAEWVALMHPARVSRLILLDGTLKIVERHFVGPQWTGSGGCSKATGAIIDHPAHRPFAPAGKPHCCVRCYPDIKVSHCRQTTRYEIACMFRQSIAGVLIIAAHPTLDGCKLPFFGSPIPPIGQIPLHLFYHCHCDLSSIF